MMPQQWLQSYLIAKATEVNTAGYFKNVSPPINNCHEWCLIIMPLMTTYYAKVCCVDSAGGLAFTWPLIIQKFWW